MSWVIAHALAKRALKSPESPASYVIFQEAGVYKARNVDTGLIEFESDDIGILLKRCVDAFKVEIGGRIFIRRGTYDSAQTHLLDIGRANVPVWIEGEGFPYTTILRWSSTTGDGIRNSDAVGKDAYTIPYTILVVRSLRIVNTAGTSGIGIDVDGYNGFIIEDVDLVDATAVAGSIGIRQTRYTSGVESIIKSCRIIRWDCGIRLQGDHMTVKDCHIAYYTTYGIRVTGAPLNPRIINCHHYGAGVTEANPFIYDDRPAPVVGGNEPIRVLYMEGNDSEEGVGLYENVNGAYYIAINQMVGGADYPAPPFMTNLPLIFERNRNYTGTAATVTETTATLKDSCAPEAPRRCLEPKAIGYYWSNPTGSAVSLTVEVRYFLDDGTEATVHSDTKAEGTSGTQWLTITELADIPNGRFVREVRLYAYCTATPTTGYEPSVYLEFRGIQR